MTGRVSMLNLSRWPSEGGSYRTIQRFFNTVIPWGAVYWVFFSTYLLNRESAYILVGDETTVSKSGTSTYGLSRFFSSVYGKTLPGVAFLSLSLVSVKERGSYPLEPWSKSCVARRGVSEVQRKPLNTLRRRQNPFPEANADTQLDEYSRTRQRFKPNQHGHTPSHQTIKHPTAFLTEIPEKLTQC